MSGFGRWVISSDLMHILYVTDNVPSPLVPHGGGRLLARYMQLMRQEGCSVSLVCIARPYEVSAIAEIERLGIQVFPVYVSVALMRRLRRAWLSLGLPADYAFCESVGLARAISRVLASHSIDVVHAVQPHTAWSTLRAMSITNARPSLVAHALDVAAKLSLRKLWQSPFQSLQFWARARRLALISHLEIAQYRRSDVVICHTESDLVFLRAFLPNTTRIVVVPPWFDASPLLESRDGSLLVDQAEHSHDLLYVGNSRDPRTQEAMAWFLGEVYPRVRATRPVTQMKIVSVDPKWARIWERMPGVSCVPFLPDITHLYCTSEVFVAPLLTGGGFHFKILEAFALGCPVVMTSVANDGIQAQHGVEALIADSSDDFAQAVLQVLGDPVLAARLRRSALELVMSRRYGDDQLIAKSLLTAYQASSRKPKYA